MKNILTATIQQQDNNGVTTARRVLTYTDLAPTVGEYRLGNLPTNGSTSISLTGLVSQPRQIFITNTNASGTITVTWTPTTGSSATIIVLNPGDGIGFWCQTTGGTVGISALSLQASLNTGTTYELFIGG